MAQAAICLVSVHPDAILHKDLRRIFAGVKYDLSFEPPQGGEGRIIASRQSVGGIGSFAGYVTCDKLPK